MNVIWADSCVVGFGLTRNCGGLAILVDNNKVTSCRQLAIETKNFQCLGGKITTRYCSWNMINVYWKLGFPGQDFRDEMRKLLTKMLGRISLLIVGGDLNLRVERLFEAPSAMFLELLSSKNLRQYVCSETQEQGGTLNLEIRSNLARSLCRSKTTCGAMTHAHTLWAFKSTDTGFTGERITQ